MHLTSWPLAGLLVISQLFEAAHAAAPPDKAWREIILKRYEPLQDVLSVEPVENKDGRYSVAVTNNGETTLLYFSAGPRNIQQFQEIFVDDQWRVGKWDWYGTGKRPHEIAPGQKVILEVGFSDNHKRERILGAFLEKGTNRAGLVVLAEEPK